MEDAHPCTCHFVEIFGLPVRLIAFSCVSPFVLQHVCPRTPDFVAQPFFFLKRRCFVRSAFAVSRPRTASCSRENLFVSQRGLDLYRPPPKSNPIYVLVGQCCPANDGFATNGGVGCGELARVSPTCTTVCLLTSLGLSIRGDQYRDPGCFCVPALHLA